MTTKVERNFLKAWLKAGNIQKVTDIPLYWGYWMWKADGGPLRKADVKAKGIALTPHQIEGLDYVNVACPYMTNVESPANIIRMWQELGVISVKSVTIRRTYTKKRAYFGGGPYGGMTSGQDFLADFEWEIDPVAAQKHLT